jgi:hypothetical protein
MCFFNFSDFPTNGKFYKTYDSHTHENGFSCHGKLLLIVFDSFDSFFRVLEERSLKIGSKLDYLHVENKDIEIQPIRTTNYQPQRGLGGLYVVVFQYVRMSTTFSPLPFLLRETIHLQQNSTTNQQQES